jgi:hypothetical protein
MVALICRFPLPHGMVRVLLAEQLYRLVDHAKLPLPLGINNVPSQALHQDFGYVAPPKNLSRLQKPTPP